MSQVQLFKPAHIYQFIATQIQKFLAKPQFTN